ncbi:Selenocysteine-specific elongation factor [Phytophthora ramorum]|uniref:Selenocysteine-specific elongation factor n=1 Tax=Phytophthora ramorum TaxID=164328 RepID=UPI00309EE880|nr:Selenocysteine-specific elongation factor [Phytophthora ramorum]
MSVVNVNVGVLGHVDSGKTSLVRALSTHLSTAALDKHPQSQQRGITLDLGFSSFRLEPLCPQEPSLQVTLVDCPGHASLFRTILGGVAIIDTVLMVVDCRKGLQAQTIESLLLAVEAERTSQIAAVTEEIRAFLTNHFPHFRHHEEAQVPVVPVAVAAGQDTQGIPELLKVLRVNLQVPERDATGVFCLAVDHCFAVPGNGTVLTGTVLSGALGKGDELELLPLGVKAKVKTLQVFKQEVDRCAQGDRVGVRVNGLDPSLVESTSSVSA